MHTKHCASISCACIPNSMCHKTFESTFGSEEDFVSQKHLTTNVNIVPYKYSNLYTKQTNYFSTGKLLCIADESLDTVL